MSASPSINNGSGSPSGSTPVNKHILTPLERQRQQLEKLLKNPEKEVVISAGPKEKTIRPPRETMKNVQGSSAGAGSGEFHVYKQSRRREYERIKLMEDTNKAEQEAAEFAARQKARQEAADAKTSKNRARRQKRKAGKANGAGSDAPASGNEGTSKDGEDSKRRKIGLGSNAAMGKMVFRRPGEDSDLEEDEAGPNAESTASRVAEPEVQDVPVVHDDGKIVIHDSE
ncbi:hypothetical protein NliqN6_5883 [Naganishia liquefaciens]|uniref:DUF1168 domain-containing protein n=1 Tax=Naganishia liquefaciens TaxID=104408 RepID=A0A8H3TZ02_9TREE|nr:hypothetical protein NliqN6_5883 [Naganishia liquefaciens]